MRKTIIYILVFVLLSLGVQAIDFTSAGADASTNIQPNEQPDDLLAQADPDPPPPDDMRRPRGRMDKQRRFGPAPKQFERFRKNKMLELLELEEGQKEKFMEIMEGQREQRFGWMREFMSTVDTLAKGLRFGEISDDKIEVLVDRLDRLEAAKLENQREFHTEARSILTPKQFGKLLIFEIRFESEILGKVSEFRRRHGGKPPGGRGFPGPPKKQNEEDSI